ncbi:MAG: efflux RND transporter periplasmic adaptor subunit [Stomatobaculum sp.]
MNRKLKRGLIVLIFVAAVGLIAGRFLKKPQAVEEETRPTVATETPKLRDILNTTEAIGTLEPQQKADVLPKIAGEILRVSFAVGDRVEEGQTLITIRSDALDSLKIQVDSAKIAMDDAQTALQRTQALLSTGAVSQQQLESAQSAANNTRLAWKNAKTQLAQQTDYTAVKAPISGVIETKNVSEHEQANPATPICTISGEGGMSITFGVSEQVMRQLKTGDAIEIEKGAAEVSGTVTEISERVSETSGLYHCKALVGAAQPAADGSVPDTVFSSGSKAKIKLVSDRAEQVLTVPLAAVNYADGIPYVYVLEDGKAVKRDLETGIYDREYIAVKAGVEETDQVIVSWSNEIYSGVEVMTGESAASGEESTP